MAASSSLWMLWVPQMKRTLARPKPQRARPSWAARDQRGIVGQPEIVVGAEVQHLAAADRHPGALRPLEDALVLPEPRVADLVELRLKPRSLARIRYIGSSLPSERSCRSRLAGLTSCLCAYRPRMMLGNEILVERPRRDRTPAGSPSRGARGCRPRPPATSRRWPAGARSGAKVISAPGKRPSNQLGQLARARAERRHVVDGGRQRLRRARPAARGAP